MPLHPLSREFKKLLPKWPGELHVTVDDYVDLGELEEVDL